MLKGDKTKSRAVSETVMSISRSWVACWDQKLHGALNKTDTFTPPSRNTPLVQSAHAKVQLSYVHLNYVRTAAHMKRF